MLFALVLLPVAAAGLRVRPVRADGPPMSPNPARVVTATYLGGAGTEWLSAGAMLPGGDLLLCGVSLDAELTLGGVKAKVLGADAPPLPAVTAFRLLAAKDTGEVAVPDVEAITGLGGDEPPPLAERPDPREVKRRKKADTEALRSIPRGMQWAREGESVERQTVYRKLSWFQPEATGFLVVVTDDLKTVRRLLRLPRGAGSITAAAIGDDGAVYIAGSATERIANLCDRVTAETVDDPEGVTDSTFGCRRTYLARLSGDLSRVEWLRDIRGWSIGPVLRVLDDGSISLHGPGLRTYTPQGKLLRAASIRNTRVVSGLDVNPADGRFVRVGDWMSPTGREPYRNPRLYVYDPDDRTHKHLYAWRGPFVGVDALRLVADSAVRKCAYDHRGNLVVSTWSHGGNNVMFRYPYDIERFVPNRLGHRPMSTCVSVIKMGPDHNVLASTRTDAYLIMDLACAADGSIVWLARTRTVAMPNALCGEGAGVSLAVTDPNLTGYRFFSPVPACGTRLAAGGCNDMVDGWGFASGRAGGRVMLLCLTGAVPEETHEGRTFAPPLVRPVQGAFGGGLMDGYAVLLDLTAAEPWPRYAPPKPRPRKPRPYDGPPLAWPGEGQVFELGTERYVTVKATFRDAPEAMWPSFYAGRARRGGRFVYSRRDAACDVTLDCPTVLQEEGLQGQRVCGELVSFTVRQATDRKGRPRRVAELDNKVLLALDAMGPWQREDQVARRGAHHYPRARCTVSGRLTVGPRTVDVRDADCSAQFRVPKRTDTSRPGTRPNMAMLVVRFAVTGGEIGLTGPLANERIDVKFTFSASSDVDYSAQKPKAPDVPGTLE